MNSVAFYDKIIVNHLIRGGVTMSFDILSEAKRCLNCKVPQCQKGCPINTSIPEVMQTLLKGDLNKAGQTLFDNNPLSMICSLICNHEGQCEGHCVLGKKGTPVHFSSIEHYISDSYFDKMDIECKPKNGIKAAIIGSGPAGITIAILLAKMGYDITIFESKERIGGVLRYGIPEFRLPKSILTRYKHKLLELGVKIRPNVTIGGALEISDLFRDGYKSIFIGTGVWRPKTLGVKGESLGNVHFAIDYLARPEVFKLGETVAIIGAGNSAMDVARSVLRHGAINVTLYSLEDKAAANEKELEYTLLEGADIKYNYSTKEITEEGPIFDTPDGEVHVKADSTIIAISQGPKNKLVSTTQGLKANDHGLLVVDDCGKTTVEGIYASGDVVNGARTVVEAVAYSKKVADAMDRFMQKDL